MGGNRKPGSLCVTTGRNAIDGGTLCRQQSQTPGSSGKEGGGFLDVATEKLNWMGEKAKSLGSTLSGHSKSALITIMDLVPLKPDSPYSTALLKHYVEGSGDAWELKEIPKEWQDWIVEVTKARPGPHRDLNPYNSGLYDLRNSLGHFDVVVTANKDKTKSYEIRDIYEFGYRKSDRNQRGRHGFPLGQLDETTISVIRYVLPSGEYQNPGGFKEHWDIKKIGKETVLFIPQQFLAEQGKAFEVKGSFAR